MQAYNLLKLVQRHGETLVLRKVTGSSYSPATGSTSGGSTYDYEITSYMYGINEGVSLNDVNRGIRKCVIPALGLDVEPDRGDQIVGLRDTVKILSVQYLYSSGILVCYLCEVSE